MPKTKHDPNWGGKRKGAGRPRSAEPRCACQKYSLRKALLIRHKCAIESKTATFIELSTP